VNSVTEHVASTCSPDRWAVVPSPSCCCRAAMERLRLSVDDAGGFFPESKMFFNSGRPGHSAKKREALMAGKKTRHSAAQVQRAKRSVAIDNNYKVAAPSC